MKKYLLTLLLPIAMLLSSCGGNSGKTDGNVINVENALAGLIDIKVSDFGKTIRYIPLETTDESLVDDMPDIQIVKDKIIVSTASQCIAFDKNTGKFLNYIGHRGDDPEAYTNTRGWVDNINGIIYFLRQPNELIGYDTNGNYKGKIVIDEQWMLPSYFIFTDTSIVGGFNNEFMPGGNALMVYDRNGAKTDSFPNTLTTLGDLMSNIVSTKVDRSSMIYGNWSKNGVMEIGYSNDKSLKASLGSEVLWSEQNQIYYKELFNDTIYVVNNNELEPYMTFHAGSWHWPEAERINNEGNNRRIVISYVNERNGMIYFQCIQGLYGNTIVYNGLHNKETGVTKLAKYDDGIKDDITPFLPVQIRTASTNNEYAGIIEVPELLEWLEDNPGAADNAKLSFLNKLTEEMNPIVVLIN